MNEKKEIMRLSKGQKLNRGCGVNPATEQPKSSAIDIVVKLGKQRKPKALMDAAILAVYLECQGAHLSWWRRKTFH